MRHKIYLAGPDVFLSNASEHAEEQKRLCRAYGFVPLHPIDNDTNLGNRDYQTARQIYSGNLQQMRQADIIVANCNPFRGICMDDGTAYELGFCNALQKPSYGYMEDGTGLQHRTIRDHSTLPWTKNPSIQVDTDGHLVVDDFGTSINLMMQCGMTEHGGRLVIGNFEVCLQAIRTDLEIGALSITLKQNRNELLTD